MSDLSPKKLLGGSFGLSQHHPLGFLPHANRTSRANANSRSTSKEISGGVAYTPGLSMPPPTQFPSSIVPPLVTPSTKAIFAFGRHMTAEDGAWAAALLLGALGQVAPARKAILLLESERPFHQSFATDQKRLNALSATLGRLPIGHELRSDPLALLRAALSREIQPPLSIVYARGFEEAMRRYVRNAVEFKDLPALSSGGFGTAIFDRMRWGVGSRTLRYQFEIPQLSSCLRHDVHLLTERFFEKAVKERNGALAVQIALHRELLPGIALAERDKALAQTIASTGLDTDSPIILSPRGFSHQRTAVETCRTLGIETAHSAQAEMENVQDLASHRLDHPRDVPEDQAARNELLTGFLWNLSLPARGCAASGSGDSAVGPSEHGWRASAEIVTTLTRAAKRSPIDLSSALEALISKCGNDRARLESEAFELRRTIEASAEEATH